MSIVSDHLGAMRPRFALDYSLVLCENILGLLWPLAIGLAVDGLIDGNRAGLWFFVGLSLPNTAVSFVGQRYESRTFNTLYADFAEHVVQQQRESGVDTASVTGGTDLSARHDGFASLWKRVMCRPRRRSHEPIGLSGSKSSGRNRTSVWDVSKT